MATNLDAAIGRAFERTNKAITAIESGDLKAHDAIAEMEAAQPWDLVSIGQSFVRDSIQAERDEDDGRPNRFD